YLPECSQKSSLVTALQTAREPVSCLAMVTGGSHRMPLVMWPIEHISAATITKARMKHPVVAFGLWVDFPQNPLDFVYTRRDRGHCSLLVCVKKHHPVKQAMGKSTLWWVCKLSQIRPNVW